MPHPLASDHAVFPNAAVNIGVVATTKTIHLPGPPRAPSQPTQNEREWNLWRPKEEAAASQIVATLTRGRFKGPFGNSRFDEATKRMRAPGINKTARAIQQKKYTELKRVLPPDDA